MPSPSTAAPPAALPVLIRTGVALLVLHTAPLRARLYVSALVGIATATSIWTNVLHAVRLNQQAHPGGLALDDITVDAVSAIAPLALAGDGIIAKQAETAHRATEHLRSAHPAAVGTPWPWSISRVAVWPRRGSPPSPPPSDVALVGVGGPGSVSRQRLRVSPPTAAGQDEEPRPGSAR
ncbi:hypothetical protein ACFQ6B_06950 [Streptomyces wedmorensis]|uniref:Uncharacterized protein n=1 Tax=Streptomyces wedmorensis TaxID=43759 RepID=A0ABW6J332_STRWE